VFFDLSVKKINLELKQSMYLGRFFVKTCTCRVLKRFKKTLDHFPILFLISKMGFLTIALLNVLTLSAPADSISKTGKATYYAKKFEGRRTTSGAVYRGSKYTAAHKTLPFGTEVMVTNLHNGKTVKVVVNDRGPYGKGMIIDVSAIAAKEIGLYSKGVAPCKITYEVP